MRLTPWQVYYRWYLREWKTTGERPTKFRSMYDKLLSAYFSEERLAELAERKSPLLQWVTQ